MSEGRLQTDIAVQYQATPLRTGSGFGSSQNPRCTGGFHDFSSMRLSIEYDIMSNATIRRNHVERQFVKWISVEIWSKDEMKMKVTELIRTI